MDNDEKARDQNEARLRASLQQARETLEEMNEFLRVVTAAPNPYATVIRKFTVGKGKDQQFRVLTFIEGKLMELAIAPDLVERVKGPGTVVKLSMKTMQPIDVVGEMDPLGSIVGVKRVIDAMFSEIEGSGGIDAVTRLVYNGEQKPEVGDRVVLDKDNFVILRNLGKEDDKFTFGEETNVSWDDIGGLEEAKEALIDAVELPYRHPDIYQKYGKKLPKGALLHGPPGCGKTMLGKATATSIARIHGKKTSTAFHYVKAPELLSKWVGESERAIRELFEKCRAHKRAHGYPATVFIDEADAILPKRGSNVSCDVEKTIVPMFLSEMDGLEDSSAFVLLATNRPDVLDPAVIREGRIDRKIRVGRPSEKSAVEIFSIHLDKRPLAGDATIKDFAKMGAAELYSEERPLYSIERKNGEVMKFTLGHVTNGAMIAAVVEEATSVALHRDLKGGRVNGIKKDDLTEAVDLIYHQHQELSHKDDLEDFTHSWKGDVKGVRRVGAGV